MLVKEVALYRLKLRKKDGKLVKVRKFNIG